MRPPARPKSNVPGGGFRKPSPTAEGNPTPSKQTPAATTLHFLAPRTPAREPGSVLPDLYITLFECCVYFACESKAKPRVSQNQTGERPTVAFLAAAEWLRQRVHWTETNEQGECQLSVTADTEWPVICLVQVPVTVKKPVSSSFPGLPETEELVTGVARGLCENK